LIASRNEARPVKPLKTCLSTCHKPKGGRISREGCGRTHPLTHDAPLPPCLLFNAKGIATRRRRRRSRPNTHAKPANI